VVVYFRPRRILGLFKRITTESWKSLLGNILYACVISPVLIVTALEDGGDVTIVIILLQTNSAFYAFFSWLLYGERVTRRCVLGLGIVFVGILLLMFLPGAAPVNYVHLCSIGAAACNALGSCMARKTLEDSEVMPVFLLLRNLFGAVIFFGLALSMFELDHFANAFSPGLWPLMLVYAALVVLLGQLTWFKAIAGLSSESVSTWSTIVPALALLFAWLLVGSIPTSVQWIGIVIVIAGLTISKINWTKKDRPSTEKPGIDQRPLSGV